jgi:rhamnosyltransferase
MSAVTVAIPVRNGGPLLAGVLRALARQTVAHELLVCDSGSRDGSVELARERGARVIEIDPAAFGHGTTRNLLMREANGEHVALLSQDAEPADERWLERMLAGFELAPDVAIAFGPYVPRPDAPLATRVELQRWFASLAPDGAPQLERLSAAERSLPAVALVGRRGFFTDANACILRAAWERTPFRAVSSAEDRALAIDVLRAGGAKAYLPQAAVLHSHRYGPLQELRRGFDEWRGLREVYGWREPASPRALAGRLRGELSPLRAELQGSGAPAAERARVLAAAGVRDCARAAGAILGSRADALSPPARRVLSLERRSSFLPVDFDLPANA